MAAGTRSGGGENLSLPTLITTALASAGAAVIVSQFSESGSAMAAALTAIFVPLLREAFHRPAKALSTVRPLRQGGGQASAAAGAGSVAARGGRAYESETRTPQPETARLERGAPTDEGAATRRLGAETGVLGADRGGGPDDRTAPSEARADFLGSGAGAPADMLESETRPPDGDPGTPERETRLEGDTERDEGATDGLDGAPPPPGPQTAWLDPAAEPQEETRRIEGGAVPDDETGRLRDPTVAPDDETRALENPESAPDHETRPLEDRAAASDEETRRLTGAGDPPDDETARLDGTADPHGDPRRHRGAPIRAVDGRPAPPDASGRGAAPAPVRRPALSRRPRVRIAILTGLLAFLIAAVALTVPELIAGSSIGGGEGRTTLFSGGGGSETDSGSDDGGEDGTVGGESGSDDSGQGGGPSDEPVPGGGSGTSEGEGSGGSAPPSEAEPESGGGARQPEGGGTTPAPSEPESSAPSDGGGSATSP